MPLGIRISQALLPVTGPDGDLFREALTIVDSVHTDGSLSPIPLVWENTSRFEGLYERDAHETPVRIVLSRHAQEPLLSTIHEIGHFLDHQAIDGRGQFASVQSSLLNGWRQAVHGTWAVQNLRTLEHRRSVRILMDDGTVVPLRLDRSFIRYSLHLEELFARSYAQFIAYRSGHLELRRQLAVRLNNPAAQIYSMQWQEADFAPIASALQALFQQIGWNA